MKKLPKSKSWRDEMLEALPPRVYTEVPRPIPAEAKIVGGQVRILKERRQKNGLVKIVSEFIGRINKQDNSTYYPKGEIT